MQNSYRARLLHRYPRRTTLETWILSKRYIIVFFKRMGSRHIQKLIRLQEGMNGIDKILCKTDLNPMQRLAYKCNTFKHDLRAGVCRPCDTIELTATSCMRS